jgi:micrococcal nuclease
VYEYRATILDVIDGDTVHAEVQLGCDVTIKLTLRLAGINAPELHVGGQPNQAGVDARSHLISLVAPQVVTSQVSPVVTLSTIKDHKEKFGRYLAFITTPSGIRVNDQMVLDGYAVAWDGRGPRPGG